MRTKKKSLKKKKGEVKALKNPADGEFSEQVWTIVDSHGNNLVHYSAANGSPGNLLYQLLKANENSAKLLFKAKNRSGETPLLLAARVGGCERAFGSCKIVAS